jgi:hypothetical protein
MGPRSRDLGLVYAFVALLNSLVHICGFQPPIMHQLVSAYQNAGYNRPIKFVKCLINPPLTILPVTILSGRFNPIGQLMNFPASVSDFKVRFSLPNLLLCSNESATIIFALCGTRQPPKIGHGPVECEDYGADYERYLPVARHHMRLQPGGVKSISNALLLA